MRVLVACEFSGIVRDAFGERGHDAWSCDLLPTERPRLHFQRDVLEVLGDFQFDLMVAFPPCTHLALSGARWWPKKRPEQETSISFVTGLLAAPVPKIAVENPIGILNTRVRKPDQIIQPWQFGHGEKKATCFWLKGLPLLQPTHADARLTLPLFLSPAPAERHNRVHREAPGPDRWKRRSRTLPGIASAMADQWGRL